MSELIGRTLGAYRIIAEIGHGGMADVYRAEQPSVGREVAIKVLPAHFLQDRTFLERFTREVKVIAQLQHPRILPVYDSGERDGMPYIVMAYMPGGALADRIQKSGGGMALDEIARLVSQMAEGLDFAHEQGIIHRDFKPSNVLLDRKGNAYLADFGIAKVTADTAQLTGSGMVGTPAYMAPEMSQLGGVTASIDVYALGVTLFQMLTGQHPYRADTPVGVLLAHVTEPIPNAHDLRRDLPTGVQSVIEKAMAKKPAQRYRSAGELAADLRAATGEVAPARSARHGDLHDDGATLQVARPAAGATPRRGLPRNVLPVVGLLVLAGLVVFGLTALLPALGWPSSTPASTPSASTSPFVDEGATTGLPESGPSGALTLSQQRVLYPNAQQVRHVAFSQDGKRLVSGAESAITLWDAQTGASLISIDITTRIGAPARAPDVAFSPDGKWVAGMANLVVMLWDAETGELQREFEGHTGYPISLAFSPDGRRLVSSGEDHTAILWNVETGAQVAVMTTAEGMSGAAFAPGGAVFAVGAGWDVILADAETGGQFLNLKGHTASVNDVAYSSSGGKIASASADGTVIVWDVDQGQQIYRLSDASGAAFGVTFSPDERLLAASTESGRILIWEMNTGSLLTRLDAHEGEIYDLAFSPDGGTLACSSADTTISLWDVR